MNHVLTTTGAAALLLAAGALDARELRVAPAVPPAHPAHSHLYTPFVERLAEESDGRLTARIMGPEVVNLVQMKDALVSELVEVGNLLPFYFPAELPNMAMAGELALSGRNPHAMAAATTEYVVTCETCMQEMRDLGVTYLGSGSSDVYVILTTTPVTEPGDLQGLRLRSGGAPFSRLAEQFGATPVSMSVGDQFEAISQGAIDGSIGSIADLVSFRLIEVISDIAMVEIGTFHSPINFAVGNTVWDSLSEEDRAAMARAANYANVAFTQRWGYDMPAEVRQAAREAGLNFNAPSDALVDAINAYAVADVDQAIALSQNQFGLADADERVARFLDLVEKWTAIIDETGNDVDAIAARIQEEVWDQVDYSTFGLGL